MPRTRLSKAEEAERRAATAGHLATVTRLSTRQREVTAQRDDAIRAAAAAGAPASWIADAAGMWKRSVQLIIERGAGNGDGRG